MGSVSLKRTQIEADLDSLKRDVKQMRVKLDSTAQDIVKLMRLVVALPDTFEKSLARFYGADHSHTILDSVKTAVRNFCKINFSKFKYVEELASDPKKRLFSTLFGLLRETNELPFTDDQVRAADRANKESLYADILQIFSERRSQEYQSIVAKIEEQLGLSLKEHKNDSAFQAADWTLAVRVALDENETNLKAIVSVWIWARQGSLSDAVFNLTMLQVWIMGSAFRPNLVLHRYNRNKELYCPDLELSSRFEEFYQTGRDSQDPEEV